MTDSLHIPQPPPAHHERPYPRDLGRWEKERSRALRTGHLRDRTCSAACEIVLVHERTRWGWLAWTVPGNGSPPEIPHQIGVLTPAATRIQRLALRWTTRRPARHLACDTVSVSLRLPTAGVALISVIAAVFALRHGVPLGIALPAMLLAPLLAEHLPGRLDVWADGHVRRVEGVHACRSLQRLTTLHTGLVQAAAGSDRYELRRSAEVGQGLLWDAADLLQTKDMCAAAEKLITLERLMLQLAHQVTQILKSTAQDGTADVHQASDPARPLSPPPAWPRPTTHPAVDHAPNPPLQKGTLAMSPHESAPALTPDVYLLFAHEPYYPDAAREINTTVVAAASLLHPRLRQPDGARIHDLLARGRRPGEIVPLSTLTHELDAGARWPEVGDWEAVTEDLLQLIRDHNCDALSLGLPLIARALLCAGPHSQVVRAHVGDTSRLTAYGPDDRGTILAEIDKVLTPLVAERALWPGDDLLPALSHRS
ncbi:hypothetical protein ACFVOK_18805 [Streptomyces sp. NPDC057798]|uniref:hypothetical protein n=1 Tax=Streptomyces sp. NPDC057798 TaxID=3346252 RepID=UPI0036841DB7